MAYTSLSPTLPAKVININVDKPENDDKSLTPFV